MIRDFIKLLLSGDRGILEKAEEYRAQREKRYADFELSKKTCWKDSAPAKDDEIQAAIERIREFTVSLGIASTEDLSVLKEKIDALNEMVDSLNVK